MLLYQKANSAHYKQKPRKKIHMRITPLSVKEAAKIA